MRHNRGSAIVRLFEALGEGDAFAWGFVGFFVVVGLGIGLFALKISRDHRREDEERAKKYGRKKKD